MQAKNTSLYNLHSLHNAKFVNYTGFNMPMQYTGILDETINTRSKASIFDVSHMGQIFAVGDSNCAKFIECLLPCDVESLQNGRALYTQMLDESGGIIDDMIISRIIHNQFVIVVNAVNKQVCMNWMKSRVGQNVQFDFIDKSLIAIQGPLAYEAVKSIYSDVEGTKFMQFVMQDGAMISRSGYTGEDGFEISVSHEQAPKITETLLNFNPNIKMAGLGARDCLRIEAGMCLWGNDIGLDTTPVEAGLSWSVRKRDLDKCIGGDVLERHLKGGATKKRVGIVISDRRPMRKGDKILHNSKEIGFVTSGTYSPHLKCAVGVGYVEKGFDVDNVISIGTREASIVKMPFVPHRMAR